MGSEEVFPRDLSALEQKLLLWILPADRAGYAVYRKFVNQWNVAAMRPRAEGCYVMTAPGSSPDLDASPPQIIAVGLIEGPAGVLTVNVRELQSSQLEFEISGQADQEIVSNFERLRKRTLSSWSPARRCPFCDGRVREVVIAARSGRTFVLALCPLDQRMWIHDDLKEMNIPVPVTGFYNELMLQAGIQDPGIALQSRRLFTDLDAYSDVLLSRAFEAYNRARRRVDLDDAIALKDDRPSSWLIRLRKKMLE